MIELKLYRTDEGTKTVLVNDKGHKHLHVLMMGAGKGGRLAVKKVPQSEKRYMKDCPETKKRRSISGAISVFASYGRNVGSTKEAKRFLRECRS